jgi:hypothetical protein
LWPKGHLRESGSDIPPFRFLYKVGRDLFKSRDVSPFWPKGHLRPQSLSLLAKGPPSAAVPISILWPTGHLRPPSLFLYCGQRATGQRATFGFGRAGATQVRGKHYIHPHPTLFPKGPGPYGPPAGEGDMLDFSRHWRDSLVTYRHKELYKVKLRYGVHSRQAISPHPGCGALSSDTRRQDQSNTPRYPSKTDNAHSRSGTGD